MQASGNRRSALSTMTHNERQEPLEMSRHLTPERVAEYARGAAAHQAARDAAVAVRREKAWTVARQAVEVLKRDFGAARVWLFGSLLQPQDFHERSDVDLAVEGLDERNYLRAVARLLDLDPSIAVDVVEMEHARPELREMILREASEHSTEAPRWSLLCVTIGGALRSDF